MKNKWKGDTIPGVAAVVVGLIIVILTLAGGEDMTILVAKKRGNVPGPGFFPMICGALMIIFGAALAVRGIRQNGTVHYFEMTEEMRGNIKTAVLVLAGLIAFLVLWKLTNWFVPLVFVYAVYLNMLFKRSWKFTLIFSVIITAFIYFLFVRGFSVTFRV
ncbi:MAG: tripartite tricarboxylate transporter TctB family protein [Clostridia bacterium]|nr:tripartite tricarboxylate transporter TctB family protein [Clostridia bacterium]